MNSAVPFLRHTYDFRFFGLHFGTFAFVAFVTGVELSYVHGILADRTSDWPYISVCLFALVVGFSSMLIRQHRIALAANALGLLFLSLATSGVTCALMLYSGRHAPLIDPWLARADHLLGFDWRAHVEWMLQYPEMVKLLGLVYNSITFQPLLLIAVLVLTTDTRRLYTFLNAALLALIITSAAAFFLPALGAYEYYRGDTIALNGSRLLTADRATIPLMLMRLGEPAQALAYGLQGLVYFPSFHTVCALIYIWAAWNVPVARWVVLALNMAMLAATPMHGSHYLIDMIAGAAVAAASLWIVRRIVWSTMPAPTPSFGWRRGAGSNPSAGPAGSLAALAR